jgi:hypothetical protein
MLLEQSATMKMRNFVQLVQNPNASKESSVVTPASAAKTRAQTLVAADKALTFPEKRGK